MKERVDVEVRSSGPGPRTVLAGRLSRFSMEVETPWAWSRWQGHQWLRWDRKRNGKAGWVADGVAIIIRRAS